MKLIKPSFEIWEQPAGLEGVYKQIERVGRVCYKSEDKITEDSAKPFVDRMIKSGHGAMLEHGTVYLYIRRKGNESLEADRYLMNPYSKVVFSQSPNSRDMEIYITTNLRVLVENGWLDDLKYICEPTEYHERRVTVHFVCDRGVSHEFVRHRVMSFAQESTRYCNYSKDKFGSELTFIIPCWMDMHDTDEGREVTRNWNFDILDGCSIIAEEGEFDDARDAFLTSLNVAEHCYLELLQKGWTTQQARAVLPNSLKTELVVTGFIKDWKHFFSLRSGIAKTGKPHPQAQELAEPLMDEFVKRGIMETLIK
jgi:thymidylate synthase (FAD)